MRRHTSSIHTLCKLGLLARPALSLSAALALSATLLGPVPAAHALEWKTPGTAKPAASLADAVSIESVSTEVVPLPAPPLAPPANNSPNVTKASAESRSTNPDVGLSERLELSNGAELVWVTDQSAAEKKSAAQKKSGQKKPPQRTAQKTSPTRTTAKQTSLDTASALNSKALAATTKKAQAETAAGSSSPANGSNSCSPRAKSCCTTSAGKSCGGDCTADCCDNGCGRVRCRGCGRIGCLGCGLCHKGDYMDRFANCNCDGSYKFPVPPLYTYHWPGMYSHQLMTDYHSPWRYPPLRPYTDEPSDDQLAPVE